MKKSKIVLIGLLAISVAGCHKDKKKAHGSWDDYQGNANNSNYYINDGNGYRQGGISPIWIYMAYRMGQNNRVMSSPGFVYSTRGNGGKEGGFHSSEFGVRSGVSRGSVSRGGFGSSGSHVGA